MTIAMAVMLLPVLLLLLLLCDYFYCYNHCCHTTTYHQHYYYYYTITASAATSATTANTTTTTTISPTTSTLQLPLPLLLLLLLLLLFSLFLPALLSVSPLPSLYFYPAFPLFLPPFSLFLPTLLSLSYHHKTPPPSPKSCHEPQKLFLSQPDAIDRQKKFSRDQRKEFSDRWADESKAAWLVSIAGPDVCLCPPIIVSLCLAPSVCLTEHACFWVTCLPVSDPVCVSACMHFHLSCLCTSVHHHPASSVSVLVCPSSSVSIRVCLRVLWKWPKSVWIRFSIWSWGGRRNLK